MMRVLLLGGTGTLSTAICRLAVNEGIEVSVLNRGNNNSKLPEGVTIYKGNFHSKQDLLQCLEHGKYDVIIDFLSRIPSDIEHVYSIFSNSCQQFIFISSACVYRRNKEDFPIKETSPKPNKDWSYNIEKYNCEKRLIELSKSSGSYYTIVRPYITYNEERIPLGIAPLYKYHRTLIERFKAGKPWFVWDEGKAITTVTYVEDFAKGVVGLFLNENAENEDFHITGDFSYTQKQLIEIILKRLSSKSRVLNISTTDIVDCLKEYKQMMDGDRVLDAVFDNSKIKAAVPELVFNTDIEKGLEKIINHWTISEPLYDYSFEARIDRMLSKNGIKTSFIRYPGSESKSFLIYFIYKFIPYKIARRLTKWI